MDRAMRGVDAVVHCAVGTSWDPAEVRRVTVDGTRTVAEAAARSGVRRFVHISTMSVHQRLSSGVLDESVPLNPPPDDSYGRNKLQAEEAVRKLHSLSSIILRPARIYGPFSKTFTVRPLQALSQKRLAISGNPDVPSNMVYIDNVVGAIALALEAPDERVGSSYLINDPDQLTLQEFFDFFGRAEDLKVRLVPAPAEAAPARGLAARWLEGSRAIVLSSELRALVHRILDTDPVGAVPRWLWNASPDAQAKLLKLFRVDPVMIYRPSDTQGEGDLVYNGDNSLVSSAKAERELGFRPIVSREDAMDLTLTWSRYARLVG
jgi:nucleoside-diphosphate-sugar epimerase